MSNDAKINEVLKNIQNKKQSLGERPKARWSTNGIIIVDGTTYNLNTINTSTKCVEIVAGLLSKTKFIKEAQELLGIKETSIYSDLADSLADVKLRSSIIQYDMEVSKIEKLEKQLKDLRSADAKTAEAIDEIAGLL